jgi:hypothetical protein
MARHWTIHSSGVKGGGTKSELIHCRLTTNDDQSVYNFETPDGKIVVSTPGGLTPLLPFNFPKFNSKLAGSDDLEWYITVNTLDYKGRNEAQGYWSHTHFVNPGDEPPDTWVAQAGTPVEGESESSAASG